MSGSHQRQRDPARTAPTTHALPTKVSTPPAAPELEPAPDEWASSFDPVFVGQAAAELKSSAAFAEVLARGRRSIWSAWRKTRPEQTAERETLHADWRAWDRLEAAVNGCVADGKAEHHSRTTRMPTA